MELKLDELPYEINEEIKLLRTNLQFCGAEKKVICITSAVASEGKSTTVLNLCLSLTEQNKRVLLIDADLRKSVLRRKISLGKLRFGRCCAGWRPPRRWKSFCGRHGTALIM